MTGEPRLREHFSPGRRLTHHAPRHAFAGNLALAGVPPALAQRLPRHSDPKPTANARTHFRFDDQAAAIAKLPTIGMPEATAATGAGSSVGYKAGHAQGHIGGKSGTKNKDLHKRREQPKSAGWRDSGK